MLERHALADLEDLISALHFDHVSFSYSTSNDVLEDVSFDLGPGWTGVVGANGCGKSTLLALVEGALTPTAGSVLVEPKDAVVARCPQDVDAPTPLIDALASTHDGLARRWMGRLGLDPEGYRRWSTMSPGERKRWQIASVLASEPDVILLDEPTNHLDADANRTALEGLGAFRGVGLVVSHDRSLLDSLTERTLRIQRGRAQLWATAYTTARHAWIAEAEAVREQHAGIRRDERRLRRRLADERRAADQAGAARRREVRSSDRRDHDVRSMAAKKRHEDGALSGQRRRTVVRADLDRTRRAGDELEVSKDLGSSILFDYEPARRNLLLRFEGALVAGGTTLADHLDVTLGRDDRVRLVGPNGAGKSTLLDRLVAESTLPPDKILHLPQELDLNAGPELIGRLHELPPDRRGRVLSIVAALGVDPDPLLNSSQPSPGEARKLALALGLGVGVWCLLLDEPTNHLDLPSIERVENALADYPGAILLVTHDDQFARHVSTEEWRFSDGALDRT